MEVTTALIIIIIIKKQNNVLFAATNIVSKIIKFIFLIIFHVWKVPKKKQISTSFLQCLNLILSEGKCYITLIILLYALLYLNNFNAVVWFHAFKMGCYLNS